MRRPPGSSPRRGEAEPVVRRAPFSANPRVGARGQRTRQRILDASLQVFGDHGYHRCSVARITELAGCSRVSFYQYFSGKEDLFRRLAEQVGRQVSASTEAIDPLTPDAPGWSGLRAWVGRFAAIHQRYGPVFQALPVASASDEALAAGSWRLGAESVARLRSRISPSPLPPRRLDPLLALLLSCLTRSLDDAGILRAAAPDAFAPERVEVALTDVLHRSLFGRNDANVREPAQPRPPRLEFGPVLADLLEQEDTDLAGAGRRSARRALLDSGRDVFVRRGYHGTRVDDLAAAAGVSHGAFYRYFENKEHLAAVLTVRALRTVAVAFVDIPDPARHDGPAMRRWLRRYNAAQAGEAAMIRVWVDAAREDERLRGVSAAALDWGRRRMAHVLAARAFGDTEAEAIVLVALLGSFGDRPRDAATVGAAAHVFERGLLGRVTP